MVDRAEDRRRLVGVQIHDGLEMRPDGHDHVARGDLIDVHEGQGERVFVDAIRRDLVSTDPAEHAGAFHRSHCTGVTVTVPWDES